MPQARKVTLHRRADMAFEVFSPREQAKVKEVVRMLGDPDSDAIVRARAVRMLTPEPMYLMRAGPSVRVIFSKSGNDVEILDLVRPDTLRAFAKKYAGAAGSLDKKIVEAQESLGNAKFVKLRVRAGESIQEAVRRFRKLCERSGLRKAYYEKPSERRRREELKRLRKARQSQRPRV